MSTKAGVSLENTPISDWLQELHMECYKKNLEDFDTIKTLLDIKETELKKLGVYNSKDRAAMLGSLANYRAVREETSLSSPSIPAQQQHTPDSASKSVLRKGSLKKNLKSFLGSGSAKKTKKKPEGGPLISAPSMASSLDLSEDFPADSRKPSLPDYEDPDSPKHFQGVAVKAVENEYVPSPQGSPRFDAHRQRAHTFGEFHAVADTIGGLPSVVEEEDSPASLLKHKHLSVISMESGLSFGYDIEKDFNPTLPLDYQPWYHGRITRAEAEGLLHEDGDFLIRENTTMADTYTLSMHWRGRHDHTLIGTTEVVSNKRNIVGGTAVKYQFEGGAFDSIPELIYNHLKYQIPLDKDAHNLILNPVCRMGGNKGPIYGDYSHPPPPAPVTTPSDDVSTFYTLPKNFGSRHKKQPVTVTSSSPEPPRHYPLRPAQSMSISPRNSPRNSPGRDVGLKTCSSSGDLLESTGRHASPPLRQQRNAFSPPPVFEMRPRASTITGNTLAPAPRERVPSFEDYEMMESVSIKEFSPPPSGAHLGDRNSGTSTSSVAAATTNTTTTPSTLQRETVKYAEIRYPRAESNPSFRRSQAGSAVKYAEVRFSRAQNGSAATPHPFSMYDTIPPPKHANPYQSRAEVLAQKLQADSNPTASDSPHRHLSRVDSTPHPFSHYASLQSLPRQSSTPAVPGTNSRNSMVPIAQTDITLYSLPNKVHQNRLSTAVMHQESPAAKNQESTPAKNRVSTASSESSRASPGLVQSSRVLKGLPGYDALVKLHTLFSNHSNEDIAFHVTKADAVCFLLAPRPGEDRDVWKERIRQVTSSSGAYVGLQTLGDPDGEKLWKKLYFRHQNFSQLVSLCIVSAGDTLDRAKMLRRFIDIAYLLQSSSFGNLFSFVAIMQGIASPQVTDMTGMWRLLHCHFSNTASKYKELQGFISGLSDNVAMYDLNQLSVPAIQHLKAAFHYEEQSIPGFAPVREDRSLLGEYSSLLVGLDGIRTIVSHCSQFCYNARRRLDRHQYDATFMDFLMQDYTRVYLQEMGVSVDGHLERRRRFGVLLDALVDRVEALESTEV